MNYADTGRGSKVSIKGMIVSPDGENKNRREVVVADKLECFKLPINKYPVTHKKIPEGIRVVLANGVHECEASFHRYEKDGGYCYIGSARKRLRKNICTSDFRAFLEKVGAVMNGTNVMLDFDGDKINLNRAK